MAAQQRERWNTGASLDSSSPSTAKKMIFTCIVHKSQCAYLSDGRPMLISVAPSHTNSTW